jgi:isopenicillin N synthase-like dioxygenase
VADADELPVIDVSPLVGSGGDPERVARAIDSACRERGFFYAVGHGVPDDLSARLDAHARSFFALDEAEKAAIAMVRGGRAWRGWFPLGGELTSGVPDHKEGLYFGAEMPTDHPKVRSGTPLHGPNLFPERPEGLRSAVLDHIDAMTSLGHALVAGLGLALGLGADWFDRHLTRDPLVLFRIFRYPPALQDAVPAGWGVAEHTDYGLLTMLGQDSTGGLEVRSPSGWSPVPPIAGSLVCNLGDMLERMTAGRYRSTPHRVRNTSATERLSYPFFFDPGWDAEVVPVPGLDDEPPPPSAPRWDDADLFELTGTYGDYLLGKVGRVFPHLRAGVLDG